MSWLKIVHILAMVMLLGNLLMAPFWRRRLATLGGAQARAVANRSVRLADLMFTLPGWIMVLLTGVAMMLKQTWPGGWLHVSLLLFVGWIVLWHMLVLRARKAMITQAEDIAAGGQVPAERTAELNTHEYQWQMWSYVSAVLVLLIIVLMVTKPF